MDFCAMRVMLLHHSTAFHALCRLIAYETPRLPRCDRGFPAIDRCLRAKSKACGLRRGTATVCRALGYESAAQQGC